MLEDTSGKEHFEKHGYMVIKEAFPKEDLLAFRKTFRKIVSHVLERAAKKHPNLKSISITETCDEALLALRFANPEFVSVIQRLISRSPEFFRLSSSPHVFSIVRELLDLPEDSPLYLLSNGIVFTNPNDGENKRSSNFELEWHKDTFFTIPKSRFVQFWGPVVNDSAEDIGTLMVCPGSHKHGNGKQKINTDISFNHRFCMAEGEVDKYEPVSVSLELGELMIFHGYLIHASGQNISNKVRMTMIGLCHDASKEECVPVSTNYHYHGKTPEQWFYEEYGDELAKKIMFDQLAPAGEPIGGV